MLKIWIIYDIFFSNTKRGTLGEFALRWILINILGENSEIWEEQVELVVEKNKCNFAD